MVIQTGTFRSLNQDGTSAVNVKLSDTIAQSVEDFASGIGWAEGVNKLLAGLGRALNVHRASLFQTIEVTDTHIVQDYVFEWIPAPEYKLIGSPLLSMMTRSVDMPGYKELIESRKRGEWQKVLTSKVDPGPLCDILKVQDIKSMLTLPVMVEDEWWGTFGFDDCKRERDWSDVEIALLRSAAEHVSRIVLRERLAAQRKQLKIIKQLTGFNSWEFDLRSGRLWCPSDLVYSYPVPSETVSFSILETLRAIHPEDRKTLLKTIKTYLAKVDGVVFRCDLRITMMGGAIRWVQILGNVQRDERGGARRLAGIAVDICRPHKEPRQLRHEAVTDLLTGALSRHAFEQMLNTWQKNCPQERCQCSLLLLSLDQVQQVNQEHGHTMGDQLLKQFVKICLSVLSEKDKLARIEGDKFAILLPEAGEEEAKAFAGCLRERMEQTPITLGVESLALAVTIGVAVHSSGPINSANLILRADSVLHVAKRRECQLLIESELI